MRKTLALLAGVVAAPFAHSSCTPVSAASDLGSKTGWALTQSAGIIKQNMVSGGLVCSNMGSSPSYLGVKAISVSSGSSFRLAGPSSTTLQYKLLGTPTANQITLSTPTYWAIPGSSSPSSYFTAPGGAFPLYLESIVAPSLGGLAPGTYQGTVTLKLFYAISLSDGTYASSPNFQVPTTSNGNSLLEGDGTTVVLSFSLTVQPSCNIHSVGSVDFGSEPLVRRFTEQTVSVSVNCTAGTEYLLSLDNGSNADGSGQRRMYSPGLGAYLAYDVYKTNATRWGMTGSERWDSTDGDVIISPGSLRTHQATASVLPGQSTPGVGSFTDTLKVNVELVP